MPKPKLTPKQQMFCEEYLIDLNATQAAIRAGYSEKTARDIACENLAKPNISDEIAELKQKRSEKIEIDSNNVLKELLNWAYGDVTETMLLTVQEVKELPDHKRRLITGFKTIQSKTTNKKGEVVEEDLLELKFVSKEKAMEMITRHIGLYELDNRQGSLTINIPPKTWT